MSNAAKLHAECNELIAEMDMQLPSEFILNWGQMFVISTVRLEPSWNPIGKVMIRTIDGTPLSREDIYEQVRKLIAPYYL